MRKKSCPTVTVYNKSGNRMVINESDFDEKVHELAGGREEAELVDTVTGDPSAPTSSPEPNNVSKMNADEAIALIADAPDTTTLEEYGEQEGAGKRRKSVAAALSARYTALTGTSNESE